MHFNKFNCLSFAVLEKDKSMFTLDGDYYVLSRYRPIRAEETFLGLGEESRRMSPDPS